MTNHTLNQDTKGLFKVRTGKLANWSVDGALERGDLAQVSFVKLMQTRGYTLTQSTLEQDWYEHWDYKLDHPNPKQKVPFTVDVKARKVFRWYSNEPQDDYTCVEFKNTKGQPGWFKGKADYIAFERLNDFILIPLPTLKQVVKDVVHPQAGYHEDYKADMLKADFICKPYHFMRREGKKDLFYWIETSKLFQFDYAILRKV